MINQSQWFNIKKITITTTSKIAREIMFYAGDLVKIIVGGSRFSPCWLFVVFTLSQHQWRRFGFWWEVSMVEYDKQSKYCIGSLQQWCCELESDSRKVRSTKKLCTRVVSFPTKDWWLSPGTHGSECYITAQRCWKLR